MADKHASRFDAETVAKVVAVTEERRLEMKFSGPAGESLVVSVPLHEAIAVAHLICDSHEQTPFLKSAARREGRKAK
jgi:hypothetical protein